MDGFINLLKPPGMTSSDAVVFVRRRLPKGTRVGHGGTLDPDAAGVLPIMVGRAARLFDYIIDKNKRYIAEIRLGISTDTQDATGRVTSRLVRPLPSSNDLLLALPSFVGVIQQVPPAFSAIKKDGKRAYGLARMGEPIQLDARPVRVDGLSYICQTAPDRHMLAIECGKGLYVRTLLSDIGDALGCGAHMSFLLRERAGAFAVEDAQTPEQIASCGDIERLLAPMDLPLAHLPRFDIDPSHARAVGNGNPIPSQPWDSQGAVPLGSNAGPGAAPLRMYLNGAFCGIGEARDGMVRFKAMLLGGER